MLNLGLVNHLLSTGGSAPRAENWFVSYVRVHYKTVPMTCATPYLPPPPHQHL